MDFLTDAYSRDPKVPRDLRKSIAVFKKQNNEPMTKDEMLLVNSDTYPRPSIHCGMTYKTERSYTNHQSTPSKK